MEYISIFILQDIALENKQNIKTFSFLLVVRKACTCKNQELYDFNKHV